MISLECSKIDPMNGTLVRHGCWAGSIHRATQMRASLEEGGWQVTEQRDADLEQAGKACVDLYFNECGVMPPSVLDAVDWARGLGVLTDVEAGSLEYYFE